MLCNKLKADSKSMNLKTHSWHICDTTST